MEPWLIRRADYLLAQSWQIAVLTIAVALASFLLRNRSAHVRYLLWLIVLAKCLVPPLYSIPVAVLPPPEPPVYAPAPPRAARMVAEDRVPQAAVTESAGPASAASAVASSPKVSKRPVRYDPRAWLALGWLAGVVALSFYYLLNALRTQIWLQRWRKALPNESRRSIESFFTAHGVRRRPRVWLLDRISQPFVWGLVRGSIYLPAELLDGQHAKFQASLLGHELSHVLRFDALINSLQVLAQTVFWFHPFVWWANRRIRAEREKCCDEMTIARWHTRPEEYSEAIVETLAAKYEHARPVPSLAVAGQVKNIEERINTMLRPGRQFYRRPHLAVMTVALLLALLTVPSTVVLTARAQNQATAASGDKAASALPGVAADTGPTNLGPIVNSSTGEWDPHISADGLSLYFGSRRPGGLGDYDIWVTRRKGKGDPWGTPVNLGLPINSSASEGGPCTSDDALEFYFASKRPGGSGSMDIWVARRPTADDSWGAPVNLGPTVNSPAGDDNPNISADGLSLYFGSNRSASLGESDIWITTRQTKEGPWTTPVNLGPRVNSPASEDTPSISADGLSLYFGSDRVSPGLGGDGIWVTTRKSRDDPWGSPVNLGPAVNSPYDAYNPHVSRDGSTLYFISDRPGSVNWSYDIWQIVLERGTRPSSLQSAAFVGDLVRVKAYLDAGVDVNQKNASGMTALYSAASGGHKGVVELLLARGADINQKNAASADLTALHVAAGQGHTEVVELLLTGGADVDVNAGAYDWKRTAAELAMERNHDEVVRLLVAKGADISPLHLAIHMKDRDKAKSLIEGGADVNRQIGKLGAPLHMAATSGQKDLAELLIAHGADMNIRAPNMAETPLNLAVGKGDRDMVELLIAKGADVNAKNTGGRTALDIAVDKGLTEIVELLRKHGAKE